ncbi:MAG TPA: glutathione S-transferase family protein [Burkholderiaceae bacterium]|nr:glutathione S-transferase family protein [Burkholderiaceae bacterium]
MQLIGMLDSPYVRRVAISLQLLRLPFEHRSVSVFRQFDEFSRINPVVKAPTLVADDGGVLMDSTLILDYAEALAAERASSRSLMPGQAAERQQALQLVGLALAACEKSVQIIYEHTLRPAEKQHAPWLTRVHGQLAAALEAMDTTLARKPLACTSADIDQAGVSCAVAWHFITQSETLSATVSTARYPALQAHSQRAETLPEFRRAPHGDGTVSA